MEVSRIKMYKTRIKQWGLKKKKQQRKIRGVAHQNEPRQPLALERRSMNRLHGRLVDVGAVIGTKQCRQMLVEDVDIPRLASRSPETMRGYFTAVPTLSTTPGLLGIWEHIFNTIRDYYRGSFESRIWVSDQEGHDCWTVKAGPNGVLIEDPAKNLNELFNDCDLACAHFAANHYEDAGQALISATAGIKNILQAEHPQTLTLLFGLVINVGRKGRQEIAWAVLRQFSALAEVLLGDEHPLSQVCRWLASVDIACFDEVIGRCLWSAGDHLETNLGPMHRLTLDARLRSVYRYRDINWDELALRNLLDKCEHTLGAYDPRTLDIRSSLAYLYLSREDYVKARKMAQCVIDYSHQAQSSTSQIQVLSQGLYALAFSQYNLHEAESAEANLREAIAIRVPIWGPHETLTKRWLVILEEWLSEQGRLSSDSEENSEESEEEGEEESEEESEEAGDARIGRS